MSTHVSRSRLFHTRWLQSLVVTSAMLVAGPAVAAEAEADSANYVVRGATTQLAVEAVQEVGGEVIAEYKIISGVSARLSSQSIRDLEERLGIDLFADNPVSCLLYTSPSPRDKRQSRMPSSA